MTAGSDPEVVSTDVLIIGAGGAGFRTSIELAEHGIDCLVLGKRAHGDAHTIWAAGASTPPVAASNPKDRWAIHAADTLNAAIPPVESRQRSTKGMSWTITTLGDRKWSGRAR